MNQSPPVNDATDRVVKIPPVDSPRHEEALLDQAVAESFPASDPIAPAVQARMEPADVNLDERFTNSRQRRFSQRMREAAPSLIAIGTAAIALMAMRAFRNGRAARRD